MPDHQTPHMRARAWRADPGRPDLRTAPVHPDSSTSCRSAGAASPQDSASLALRDDLGGLATIGVVVVAALCAPGCGDTSASARAAAIAAICVGAVCALALLVLVVPPFLRALGVIEDAPEPDREPCPHCRVPHIPGTCDACCAAPGVVPCACSTVRA